MPYYLGLGFYKRTFSQMVASFFGPLLILIGLFYTTYYGLTNLFYEFLSNPGGGFRNCFVQGNRLFCRRFAVWYGYFVDQQ